MGKGKALKTGMRYYKENASYEDYAGIITADSDGQHLAEDVKKIQKRLALGESKLILGVRNFDLESVPAKSRIGNKLTSLVFRFFLGLSISDTQTGLRGIPNSLIDLCLAIPGDRFEYETAMLMDVGKAAEIEEVNIHTVYYDENQGTHFRPVKDSFLIYQMLFGSFFRYLFVSLSSFFVDIALFALFTKTHFNGMALRIPLAAAGARVLSGTYNFIMNRNLVLLWT